MSENELDTDSVSDVGSRLGNTDDLPEELLRLLSATKMDDLEEKIFKTLKERFDGIASLDEVIVGLYRDFGYIAEDRRLINSKLYRMSKRGILESVPKKKGVYRAKT